MAEKRRILILPVIIVMFFSMLLCVVGAKGGNAEYRVGVTDVTAPEEQTTQPETTNPVAPVSIPSPKSVTTGNGYALFKWSGVPEAQYYHVYKKVENGEWKYYAKTNKNTLQYKDKNVEAGVTYCYTVKAVAYGQESGFYSEGITVTYMNVPKNIKVSNTKDNLKVSWNKCSGAQKYKVYRKKENAKKWSYLGETAKTSYTDKKVYNGVKYTYTVRGVSEYGNVGAYNTKGTTQVTLKMPTLTVKCGNNGVKLSWTNLSKSADSYRIYRKNGNGWKLIKTIKNKNTTTYTDKSVKVNSTYTYTIRQVQGNVLGSYNTKGISTKFCKAPKLNITHSPDGVFLSWTKPAVGTGYYIDRKSESQKSWKRVATVGKITKLSVYTNSSVPGEKNYYRVRVRGTNLVTAEKMIYGIDATKPVVALTFDDGPYTPVTRSILNTLENNKGRATFFVVGNRVSEYSEVLKEAFEQGCQIGNHTYGHVTLTTANNSVIDYQINATNNAVKEVTGKAPVIVRAPGGAVNNRVLNRVDYPFVGWNVDTLDWKSLDSQKIFAEIKRSTDDGDIVLMHDLYRSTATAVESAVPWLTDNGYQLVTVSELMQIKNVDFKPGKVYYYG